MSDTIKFKDNIDLSVWVIGFTETETSYELESPFDEFISVDKCTRVIKQVGYTGPVMDWLYAGLLESC